ncbi:MAG TPA: methyltransferase, partial [Alphaproteobacteria bacterium]
MPNPSLPDFLSVAQDAQKRAIFVRLQLAGYKGHDESLKKIIIRPVLIKQKPNLSFTFQHKTRDIVKNFPLPDAWHAVSNALQNGFKVATLFTTDFDMAWPSGKKNKPTYTESPNLSHDHQKKRVIAAEGQAWLHALGITGADGKVLQSGQDKYKQINKFIELIAPIVADIKIPHVADMGSGKGYLTFAL